MRRCEASWGQLRGVGDNQVQISVGRGEQPSAAAGSAWPGDVLVSDPKTRSIEPLCHPGVSNQNFVLGAAGDSKAPIPLENRENKKGYTLLSRGLLTTLF